MALNSKIKVGMPQSGIITRKSGSYRYVYKILKTYRNSKGQPTNDRICIGKLDVASGMLIPNDNYYAYYPDTEIEFLPTYDSVRSIGAAFFFRRIFGDLGLTGILEEVLGTKRAGLAFTACLYMACRGNVMEHVQDFCEGFTLSEVPLSSQGASTLFASITRDERMSFFQAWIKQQPQPQYLAYDVTSFSSYAEGIADTEWGYNRDGDRLPQINLGCYLGEQSGLPMFYVTYPGSILDKSHLPYMMAHNAELGIAHVGFVMDRGFCTTANVGYMYAAQLQFILGVEIRHKTTQEAVSRVRDNMISMRYRIRQGIFARSIHGRFYGIPATLHVYYDPELAERQRSDLFRSVENMEEKLSQLQQITAREAKRSASYFDIDRHQDGSFSFKRNYDKIDRADSNNGFFCILSNTKSGSEEILDIYRRKDVIEKGFDDLKNHLDMKRMRTHSDTTTDGKLFLAFVSLIAVSHMGNKLADFMKEKSLSKASVISELEKIKAVAITESKRLLNPLTKTQKLLLKPLGLGENDLKAYVSTF
jgi:transposase